MGFSLKKLFELIIAAGEATKAVKGGLKPRPDPPRRDPPKKPKP